MKWLDHLPILQPLTITALVLCSGPRLAAAATTTYDIQINTAALVGHPAGPFSLQFALTDGSSIGDSTNTITVTDVNFGGGTAIGEPFRWGGAAGSLENSVTITDTAVLNLFSEAFIPGKTLRFSLIATIRDDRSGIPDRLSVFLIDSLGARVPTRAPAGDYFYALDIGWSFGAQERFASDPARAPSIGDPIVIDAPTVLSPCATDVTEQVNIARSGFVLNAGTGLFSQTVRFTNTTSASISGPVYLALDNLSGALLLANGAGTTSCAFPTGNPTIGVSADGIGPGASVSVVLQFVDPSRAAILYTARALAGSASR
jgi:hypothetical protein